MKIGEIGAWQESRRQPMVLVATLAEVRIFVQGLDKGDRRGSHLTLRFKATASITYVVWLGIKIHFNSIRILNTLRHGKS